MVDEREEHGGKKEERLRVGFFRRAWAFFDVSTCRRFSRVGMPRAVRALSYGIRMLTQGLVEGRASFEERQVKELLHQGEAYSSTGRMYEHHTNEKSSLGAPKCFNNFSIYIRRYAFETTDLVFWPRRRLF